MHGNLIYKLYNFLSSYNYEFVFLEVWRSQHKRINSNKEKKIIKNLMREKKRNISEGKRMSPNW